MKSINSDKGNSDSKIVENLNYIKQHLRYPWKKRIAIPLWTTIGFILFNVAFLLFEIYVFNFEKDLWQRLLTLFAPLISLLISCIAIYKYLQSLKFMEIKTGLNKALSQKLITSFLQKRHFLIYHHPDSPDIMQIVSRPLTTRTERREIVVFIADENRVLINGHFTETRWIMLMSNHAKKIAKEFSNTVLKQKQQKETSLI